MKTPREISIDALTNRFELGFAYPIANIPPVHKSDGKWTIRVIVGQSSYGSSNRISWDYFHCDLDGLVIDSPRGYSKEFNKRVKITGLDEWASKNVTA